MPVIRISNENIHELDKRKINERESYNDVISRLVATSKFMYVSGNMVEVISNGEGEISGDVIYSRFPDRQD